MPAQISAAIHLLLLGVAHAQWVDRPFIESEPTSTIDFSLSSLPDGPLNMDGAVFDSFPSQTTPASIAAAIATTAAKATAVASSVASQMASGSPNEDDDQGECRLLGPFALFVQLALGGLALMSLVFKRWRERPQRPVKIWFFDVSKQVVGSVLVHVANVFMSMLTSGRFSIKVAPADVAAAAMMVKRLAGGDGGDDGEYQPNPCSFYLLNLAIDTTIGIPILIFLLRVFTGLAALTPFGQPRESIQSGHYSNPPRAWWWLKQSLIYFCGLFGMKVCVLIIFVMFPWISRVGDWALRWTEGNEKVQIVFVMMLFPLIMNALQYYIIDSFIKKQASKEDTDAQAHSSEGGSYQRISEGSGEVHHDDAQHQQSRRSSVDADRDLKGILQINSASPIHAEYDPEVDGTTMAGGSSNKSTGPEGNMPAELYPKE